MLVTGQQVKPFLYHQQNFLRNHAVGYFAGSFSRDPDLAPAVLECCRTYGEISNLELLAAAVNFTQTELTLRSVLDRLPHVSDAVVIRYYNNMIVNADINVLIHMAPGIRKVTNMAPGCIPKIKRRIDLFSWPTNKLMNELLAFCHRNKDRNLDEMDYTYGKDIVKTLQTRDDLPLDTILTILTDEKYRDYEELYMIMLAGGLKMTAVVPVLIDNLRCNEEMLAEESINALTRIGNDVVVRGIQRCFFNEHWDFRFAAASLLGNIKSPGSEQAFLKLLPRETDLSVQTMLAYEWCNLLSDQCVSPIMELIHSGYDSDFANLEESLYCACTIMGIRLPVMEEWEKQITKRKKEPSDELLRIMNLIMQDDPVMWPPGDNMVNTGRPPGGKGKKPK